MGTLIDDVGLEKQTRAYWNDLKKIKKLSEKYQYIAREYVQKLMLDELKFARENKNITDKRYDTVVLLVGMSPEPLLQTIAVYQPKRILLLMNETYGKDNDRNSISQKDMEDCWNHLLGALSKMGNKVDARPEEITDRPESVFRALTHYTKDIGSVSSMVIDITGSKKSMVSGAFLFGAYSHIPLSYVDFDEYDSDNGRPYGYSCKIQLVSNPYEMFRLGEWPRLRELYNRAAYDECKRLLAQIIDAQQSAGIWEGEKELASMRKLHDVLNVYADWDNNDYASAWEKASALSVSQEFIPSAVRVLGEDDWSVFKDKESRDELLKEISLMERSGLNSGFYSKWHITCAYIEDELQRVERLISKKADYRSALIKAAACMEFTLRAVVFYMICKGDVIVNFGREVKGGKNNTKEYEFTVTDKIANAADMDKYINYCKSKSYDWMIKHCEEVKRLILSSYDGEKIVDFYIRCLIDGKIDSSILIDFFSKKTKNTGVTTRGRCLVEIDSKLQNLDFGVHFKLKNVSDSLWQDYLKCLHTKDDTTPMGTEGLKTIRNKTAHTCLPISKTVAINALQVAEKVFEPFKKWTSRMVKEGDSISKAGVGTVPEWERLCEECGVDFLPPGAIPDIECVRR